MSRKHETSKQGVNGVDSMRPGHKLNHYPLVVCFKCTYMMFVYIVISKKLGIRDKKNEAPVHILLISFYFHFSHNLALEEFKHSIYKVLR